MTHASLYIGLALSLVAAAQVPVEKEPRHHLGFENEWLKILEPQIPAGDTTLEHLHTYDDATVCIHGSTVRAKAPGADWGNPGGICVPGAINMTEYTGKSRSHTVQNVGSSEYHLTLVENLRSADWTTYEPLSVPGLRVLRESRAFRAYDCGLGMPAHAHQVPTVTILVSGSAMAGDKHLDRPGQAVFIPAGQQHQITMNDDARVIEIEVR